jgi:hypothetical protein
MVANPKVFISYSWSNADYADRVLKLAEQLSADGVQVILDRWDLKEGQDKHNFMERAVNDESVSRVLILCDALYAEKADGRRGGVGTETLIISPEVYREARQEKFVPVIMERDDKGEITVPTYLKGRIYIDLSDAENDEPEYHRLVRNIYGKPELTRPALGNAPAYLDDSTVPRLTGRAPTTFKDAVLRDRPHKLGLLDDYLERLLDALKKELIPEQDTIDSLDKAVVSSMEKFVPYRDEFIEVGRFIARNENAVRYCERLHKFFEEAASIRYERKPGRWADEVETENLTFLTWEMFLYCSALFLRNGNFDCINPLLEPFFVRDWRHSGQVRSFAVLDGPFRLLDEQTKQRLGANVYSLSARLLRDRATKSGMPFDSLIEADLIYWFRAAIAENVWYPRTAFYWESIERLQLFTRAQSTTFFARVAQALGVTDKEHLQKLFGEIPDDFFFKAGHMWGGRRAYAEMLQLDTLGTK